MRKVGFAAVATVLLAVGLVVTPAASVPVLVPTTLVHRAAPTPDAVTPAFAVEAVGAVWEAAAHDHGSTDGHAEAEIRFQRNGRWTAWRPMGEDGAQRPGRFATALVPGGGASSYQVRGVPHDAEVVTINTTDGPLREAGRRRPDAAGATSPCRSRADWGADESLRTGTPAYAPPQVFTVHHTADDSPDDTRPPDARVRAIYAYHVTAQRFDDIAYQYLLDEDGVVYEGRASGTASASCITAGGTGREFAHEEQEADRVVTGAHVGGNNTANIGIALLGNFQTVAPPAAAVSGLEGLLAELALRHDIDPLDTSYVFTNANNQTKTVPAISGHSDWMATACPGEQLRQQLPGIRSRTAQRMQEPPPPASTTTTTTTSTTTPTAPPATTTTTAASAPPPPPRSGYWMVAADGVVHAFGDAAHHGDASVPDAVDLEPTPSGDGYWIVEANGGVHARGDAPGFGSPPLGLRPGETVTSLSSAGVGRGYWLFTSRGRVVAVGGAPFFGDMSDVPLNGPVLDSIPTPTGRGYYLVASDGGIFTFGDAVFAGSMGATPLNAPVQSLVPDGDRTGYWLVASDGGIFAFDAAFFGSMGDVRLNRPITGMVADGSEGYLMVGEDGGIFTFGTATFRGSLGDAPPPRPITSVARVRP